MPEDMKDLPRRFARYSAGVLALSSIALTAFLGAIRGIKVGDLLYLTFWGALACSFLGWAVGHAAGRFCIELLQRDKKADSSCSRSEGPAETGTPESRDKKDMDSVGEEVSEEKVEMNS